MDSSTSDPIEIIDVIHNYSQYSTTPQVFVVISRRPKFVYEKRGNNLVAHDGGFYDYMYIEQPSRAFQAFGGREFDIQLIDGSTMHCKGQVWSGRKVEQVEPMIEVGCATLDQLRECYCFFGAQISKAKYDDWMATNTPSYNYEKYDPRSTLEWLDETRRKFPDSDRPVSKKRARKLRQRGVTVRRHPVTGKHGWSPSYERRKAEIERKNAPDYKGRFHPDVVAGAQ